MPDEPETIIDAIEENAKGVSEATVDGQIVKQHSIADQIKADQYARQVRAASGGRLGIKLFKIRPPGAS